MLELLALAREDGWAFVRDGDRIVATRPPYEDAARREVSDAVVARAVGDHGFTPSGETFVDWPAVVHHLRQQLVRVREERGQKLPSDGVGRALLRHAPAEEISEILLQVETEMLPANERSAAERMLMAALEVSPHVRRDDALYRQTLKLLRRVREARDTAPGRRARAPRFPVFRVEGLP